MAPMSAVRAHALMIDVATADLISDRCSGSLRAESTTSDPVDRTPQPTEGSCTQPGDSGIRQQVVVPKAPGSTPLGEHQLKLKTQSPGLDDIGPNGIVVALNAEVHRRQLFTRFDDAIAVPFDATSSAIRGRCDSGWQRVRFSRAASDQYSKTAGVIPALSSCDPLTQPHGRQREHGEISTS